jgi:ribonucleoside-triphosphate reductase
MEDFYQGRARMGSLQMITINLPQIAYEAGGNDDRLFELLDSRVELAKEAFFIKQRLIKRRMEEASLPFASMDCDGEPYLKVNKQSLSLGFIGLNEMLKYHTDEWLHESDEAWRFGLKVVKYLADKAEELTEETGSRFQCIQTPAESCAHRLALIDYRKYGDRVIVQGDKKTGSVYYTNSSHVQPSADLQLFKRIKIESSFHPLTRGGAILHVWLGESYPNPEAIWKLTKRIALKSLTSYFAYTKDLTICLNCSKISAGLLDSCPNCGASGEQIDWWSRITGYYQRVKAWNAGKRAELRDRHRYPTSNF